MIDAIQFKGEPIEGVCFKNENLLTCFAGGAHVHTLEGWLKVSIDDWVIKGIKGEFYPCKPDIFEATYEPA